jgi:hypothetical protein
MARITRRDLEKVYDLATGQLHKFTLHEFFGHVLEVDSVHFHLNSAVLLPNNEPPAPGEDAPPSADEAPRSSTCTWRCSRTSATSTWTSSRPSARG